MKDEHIAICIRVPIRVKTQLRLLKEKLQKKYDWTRITMGDVVRYALDKLEEKK